MAVGVQQSFFGFGSKKAPEPVARPPGPTPVVQTRPQNLNSRAPTSYTSPVLPGAAVAVAAPSDDASAGEGEKEGGKRGGGKESLQ